MRDFTGKTPLNEWHRANGANMADFAGYDMPLWYPVGAKEEHLAVINRAGLFDTSHMAVVMVEGGGAFDLIQQCFSKDLRFCIGREKGPMEPGRAVYGLFLNEKGWVVDDALVYNLADDLYMVCVNAGMGPDIADHLLSVPERAGCRVTDMTGRLGKMDIQGPLSARILSRVLKEPEKMFNRFPYFSFKGHFDSQSSLSQSVITRGGTPILLSRTGYTGEFGFEIFCPVNAVEEIWRALLEAGEVDGITPCGLAARDSLRAGAGLPLSHQDIGSWPFLNNPWPFALPYGDDGKSFTKTFTGSKALVASKKPYFTCPFAGYDPRKITPSKRTFVADETGEAIGKILTCATDMAIGRVDGTIVSVASKERPGGFILKGLSCGFVRVKKDLQPGNVILLSDGKRKIKAEIVRDIRPARTARRPITVFWNQPYS